MVSLEHTIDILTEISRANIADLVVDCTLQKNHNLPNGKKSIDDLATINPDIADLINTIKDTYNSEGIEFEDQIANQLHIEIYHPYQHWNYFEISVWAKNNPEIYNKKSIIDFKHTSLDNFKKTQTEIRLKKTRPPLDPKIKEVYKLVEKYYQMYTNAGKTM